MINEITNVLIIISSEIKIGLMLKKNWNVIVILIKYEYIFNESSVIFFNFCFICFPFLEIIWRNEEYIMAKHLFKIFIFVAAICSLFVLSGLYNPVSAKENTYLGAQTFS